MLSLRTLTLDPFVRDRLLGLISWVLPDYKRNLIALWSQDQSKARLTIRHGFPSETTTQGLFVRRRKKKDWTPGIVTV